MSELDWMFDSYDRDGFEGPAQATCRICGVEGLQWDDSTGQWVLFEADGSPHTCRDNDRMQHAAADFQDPDQ